MGRLCWLCSTQVHAAEHIRLLWLLQKQTRVRHNKDAWGHSYTASKGQKVQSVFCQANLEMCWALTIKSHGL